MSLTPFHGQVVSNYLWLLKSRSHVVLRGLASVVIVKSHSEAVMSVRKHRKCSNPTHTTARGYAPPPHPMGGRWAPRSGRHPVGAGRPYTHKRLQGTRCMHVESQRVIPHHQHTPVIHRLTNGLITQRSATAPYKQL